jgi:two-component system response regulator QseB
MRLLLIEDDLTPSRAVRHGLTHAGFTVDWVTDGNSGQAAAANWLYDAVVPDIGLPRLDGLTPLRNLRARRGAGADYQRTRRGSGPHRRTERRDRRLSSQAIRPR